MQLSNETKSMIENSKWETDLKEIVALVMNQLEQKKIYPTEIQWQILINHLSEMIDRSKAGIQLKDVDISLFKDVSEDSLGIAKVITEGIGGLNDGEIYVLSIHFEAAKTN